MKPGDQSPQEWQQPTPSLSQAPYQAPVQEPITEAPVPLQTSPVNDDNLAMPQPLVQSQSQAQSTESSQAPMVTQPAATQEVPIEASVSDVDTVEQLTEDTNDDTALLRWQATEYIHHERTALWYAVLSLVVVAFIALAIFVFNSITFAILIPVMLVALVVYVRRPPSILNYTLSRKGLHVNDHLYTYDQFKAFGVITHEDTHSVVLLPRKRFQVSQTVYFPEEVGEPLVDMIAARLPMQEVELDAIDKLLKKLRI